MARDRIELQNYLEELLGSDHVYFQPPESIQLKYPCIVYKLDSVDIKHADNQPYKLDKRYLLTVIDRDPDSTIPDRILETPMSSSGAPYTADNLHHWNLNLYW